jgi:hypothetical protein
MRADMSVVDLDDDDGARRLVISRSTYPRRRFHIRPGPLLGIVVAHAAVMALVIAMPGERVRVPETEPLVSVFIRPRVIVSREPSVAPPAIRVPKASPVVFEAVIPETVRPTIEVLGIGTMSPRPADVTVDPAPFAQRAGLSPGDGATVVMRVEVLGTGDLGRIEVEVSGGTPRVDQEAIAYVRSIPWIGGLVDGQPTTLWVRWGVRLQSRPS